MVDHLRLETKETNIGQIIDWRSPVLGNELLLFSRPLTRVRRLEATWSLRLRERVIDSGARINDFYGYGSCMSETLESALQQKIEPNFRLTATVFVAENLQVITNSRADIPKEWFHADNLPKIEKWRAETDSTIRETLAPDFFTTKEKKIVFWDSNKNDNWKTLDTVLNQLVSGSDGSKLDIPVVRKEIDLLRLATVE